MRHKYTILFSLLIITFSTKSQNIVWKAGVNYFFDNTEFAKSTITRDQTMTGVHFTPEIGLAWDTIHSFYIGTDLLKTSGSQNYIDAIQPIAYYQYKANKSTLYAGAFPRAELFSNYSDLFFQDSVKYYKPTIQGLFWQVGEKDSFFNLWLDWNGHQTAINRETFFVGASAHKKFNHFFTDFESYMFHFATTRPDPQGYGVCDNLLAHLSVGVDYSNKQGLDTLLFAVGVLGGVERDRKLSNGTQAPMGIVFRANAEFKGIGTQNTLYMGNPRMVFYGNYGTGLYWNNPFLRSNYYLESKWYYQVIRSQFVQGKLALKLHYSEGKLMFEQAFTVNASLNNLSNKPIKISTLF
ncbi:MAG: hypothetical protein PHR83_11960 [Paludibacter sp.]|nr:hypothetical protein [Paludibacter sp.]